MATPTRNPVFLPNQAYPSNNCITCSLCLMLWLQMATTAKPEIMYLCDMQWERRAWLAWQQSELLRENVAFKVTWSHPAESWLIPRATVWLLVQSCSQGKMAECTRVCKWVWAIKVLNSWNKVQYLKGESTHIWLIAVCGLGVYPYFVFTSLHFFILWAWLMKM